MRLALREKVAYALGDTACNFYWKSFEFFLLIFYTDVAGLSPAAAGTMFAITRVLDAVVDPLMGTIADRTRSPWGRFRPYLLWMILPVALAGILTFSAPPFSGTGKSLYAYATYIVMMLVYTGVNIPYSALLGVITPDSQERTSLASMRFIGGFSGGIAVVMATPWLVKTLGGGAPQRGWPLTMLVWGALAAVLFFICFAATRERVTPPARQRADLRRELADLLGNVPWLVMGLLSLVTLTALVTRSQTTAYYFKYYVKAESLTSLFLGSGMAAGIAGIALTAPATRLVGGKKPLFALLMAVSGALTAAFFFVGPTSPRLIIALNMLIQLVQGANSPLIWAMYADTADHGEWKYGRRNTGLVFAAATMAQKGGGALAGLLNGVLLTAFGYVANADQSVRSLGGIRVTMSLVPAGLCLLAAAIVLLYPLNERSVKLMEEDLRARRRSADEAATG
jgi:GPH family glycoside/pentoside/hexuronide:cation symporter